MNEKLTEQYYYVDKETSILLKQAKFNKPCTWVYRDNSLYMSNGGGYYEEIDRDINSDLTHPNPDYWTAAPLISVAKEWLKEKGYYTENISVYKLYKREPIGTIELNTENERQYNLHFIQTCCKHIIENK